MADFPSQIFLDSCRALRMLFMRPAPDGGLAARENLLYSRELGIIYEIFRLVSNDDFSTQDLEKCCDCWNFLADNS
ncbi:MAG: hypothetical protein IKB77_02380, partial [Lentisphaeria bacterium]|nr:hypothetical protein [Lentisphaeria bacterium]